MPDLSNKENFDDSNEEVNEKIHVEMFSVQLKRAVCIHSTLQFVDLFLQNLMFSHGFSTSPVIPSQDGDFEKTSKSISSFQKIRKELREIFRSHYRSHITEIAVFVGTCPIRSSYSYKVPIYICEADDSTHSSCGETCAELNDIERRKINRDLFMLRQNHNMKEAHDKNLMNKNHRLFVFVKGSEEMVNEEIEEEELPFGCKRWLQYTFTHDKCDCEGVPSTRTDGKWLRMIPFIVHSKH